MIKDLIQKKRNKILLLVLFLDLILICFFLVPFFYNQFNSLILKIPDASFSDFAKYIFQQERYKDALLVLTVLCLSFIGISVSSVEFLLRSLLKKKHFLIIFWLLFLIIFYFLCFIFFGFINSDTNSCCFFECRACYFHKKITHDFFFSFVFMPLPLLLMPIEFFGLEFLLDYLLIFNNVYIQLISLFIFTFLLFRNKKSLKKMPFEIIFVGTFILIYSFYVPIFSFLVLLFILLFSEFKHYKKRKIG